MRHERDKIRNKILVRNPGGRITMGSSKLGRSKILKGIMEKKAIKYGLDSLAVSCDVGNEPEGFIKGGVFLV